MGYEDGHVDRQIKSYIHYIPIHYSSPRKNLKSSNSAEVKDQLLDALEKSYSKNMVNKTNTKTKTKKKKKFKCRNKFKFSKYHHIAKKPLYDYQIEECKQGLAEDAINQINYILGLMESCEKRHIINCKIEEINEFIQYHNIVDEIVLTKQAILINSFKDIFS